MLSATPDRARVCLVVGITALVASGVRADIAYDAISNVAPPQFVVALAGQIQAQETVLDPVANLQLSSADLLVRLSSSSSAASFSGSITLELFSSVFVATAGVNEPNQLLISTTLPLAIDRGTDQLISFDVPLALPSRDIFTAWYFQTSGGTVIPTGDLHVQRSTNHPAIGSTPGLACVTDTIGPTTPSDWSLGPDYGQYWAIRLTTVPAPGSACVLALAAIAGARPRQRDRKLAQRLP